MKILRILLYVILSIVVVGFIAFHILKYNPKPDIIMLERKAQTDEQIDLKARELVDQMSINEKVQMMTPRLKSNLKFVLEVISDGMKYNQQSYQAGGNERSKSNYRYREPLEAPLHTVVGSLLGNNVLIRPFAHSRCRGRKTAIQLHPGFDPHQRLLSTEEVATRQEESDRADQATRS